MSRMIPDKTIIAVMPAYHAVKTLRETVAAIPDGWVDEIVLVDDASSDNTADLARRLGITTIVHQKNTGYGGNQKTCYSEALARGADIVVMIHPDFQYHPRYIPDLILPIAEGRADAVFGSRMLIKGGALRGGMPYWKFIANKALTYFENFILGLSLSEYHSGFRAYSREVLSSLPFKENDDGFIFDSEIIVQLAFGGFRIQEIPIETRYFKDASMIGFWKSVLYGLGILKLMIVAILTRWGLVGDQRFFCFHRSCPICLRKGLILWRAISVKANDAFAESYSITENTVGVHYNIFYCRHCGSAMQLLQNNMSFDAAYAAQPCDQIYLAEETGRRRTFRHVLAQLESLTRPGTILDLGCGPGLFLSEAKDHGWSVLGAEASSVSAAYARSHYGILVHAGRLPDALAGIPDNSLDVVTAFDFMEHVSDPDSIFREVCRILKPMGIFLITTPRFGSLVQRMFGGRWYAILPAHLVYFSDTGIDVVATRNRFSIILRKSLRRHFSLSYLWFRLSSVLGFNFINDNRNSGVKKTWCILPIQLFDEHEIYLRKLAVD